MKTKEIYAGIVSIGMICLMLSIALSQGVHLSGLPKVDEILFKAYPSATPDTIVDEFLMEVTDWIDGPYRIDLYQRMIAAGEKISPQDPMAKFDFIAINCRDYKENLGSENFPLNDSMFRLALSYIYGVNDKQSDIFGYVGADWTFAIGNPCPPAQEPWYDESIQMPDTDWDQAWTILAANGYSIDGDNDLCYGSTKLRNLEAYFPTGSLYWGYGPGFGFVRNFNDFISYIGADSPVMALVPVSYSTLVLELLVFHDFDLVCHSLTDLGRYVDWMYDCLHSDNIVAWGWNFCGISDADFDTWTEIILTDLDVNNVIDAASLVQDKFVYELIPWLPVSSGRAFCTTARDTRGELMNLISMPNYGPMNDWSWMCLHWKGAWPGGTLKVALGDEWGTMNPYTEHTPYGWQILDRAVTGLLSLDPNTLITTPFIATDWSQTPWISIPELGITDGSVVTFYLRQDVLWHDLEPVTAYDCVNNMRLLRQYRPGRYSSTWAQLVYEETDGPYKFNAYFYTPSLFWIEKVAETALLSPKHITDAAEAMYGSIITDWDPAFNTYEDLMGVAPPAKYDFMKQIVGCGPFVYDYAEPSIMIARVQKFDEFFVNAPVIAGVVGEWRNEPGSTYPYKVLVQNIAAKEDSENGELVPVTVNVTIYEDDVLKHELVDITLDPWECQYLGPYTTDTLDVGAHTIKVEIVGSLIFTYTHTLVATIKEDLNTCDGSNLDFRVDVQEMVRVAFASGSYPGHPEWDSYADVNDDFKVDLEDMFIVAAKFGWPNGGAGAVYNISVTDVTPSKTVVAQGSCMNISVTVENYNFYGEQSLNVIAYYNDTAIILPDGKDYIEIYVTSAGPYVLSFKWNTTGVAIGNYTIKAFADNEFISYETNITDNTLVDGFVYVGIQGDVDGNNFVEVKDLIAIAMAYGSYPGHPKYDPNLDVNGDEFIDVKDILIAALNYGQHYP